MSGTQRHPCSTPPPMERPTVRATCRPGLLSKTLRSLESRKKSQLCHLLAPRPGQTPVPQCPRLLNRDNS